MPAPCMYCVQQWPMFKHPQKQNTQTIKNLFWHVLAQFLKRNLPKLLTYYDHLRPTHEIAFETHSTLTSPKTIFGPASLRSGLVADCSWLFSWAACLNISSMSWIEERHGREELETSSQDCPHQDGDRKHRELKYILFWISDAAFASFSKLATSIGYFLATVKRMYDRGAFLCACKTGQTSHILAEASQLSHGLANFWSSPVATEFGHGRSNSINLSLQMSAQILEEGWAQGILDETLNFIEATLVHAPIHRTYLFKP